MKTKMITVVSGLPRSGTSLMMQILEAAGLEVLTDNARRADPDNPRGYYELKKVLALGRDKTWLGEAEGKVIKVVSMLLYELPQDREYRVVFMTRKMSEILASQSAMLQRSGQTEAGPSDDMMRQHFEKHLAKLKPWLAQQSHLKVIYCDYNAILADPRAQLEALAGFLELPDSLDRMVGAVDKSLYRQRK